MDRAALTKRNVLALSLGIFFDALGVAAGDKVGFRDIGGQLRGLHAEPRFSGNDLGMWSYTYQFGLFVLMCLLVKRCLPGDVLSFLIGVVFGYTLDVCRFLVGPLPLGLLPRALYFLAGNRDSDHRGWHF